MTTTFQEVDDADNNINTIAMEVISLMMMVLMTTTTEGADDDDDNINR